MLNPSIEGLAVVGFQGRQTRVEQPGLWNDNHVESRHILITAKNLSYQSFSSISLNGSPQLLCGGDTKAVHLVVIRKDKECAVATLDSGALLVHPLEFDAAAEPLVLSEPETHDRSATRC